MANKYLPGGALNPAWCDEQDANMEAERITDALLDIFNDDLIDADVALNLGDGVMVTICNKDEDDISKIKSCSEDEYEAKFQFIKRHSDNEEDLKLAREIIGLTI